MRRDSREAVYKILFAELFNPTIDEGFEQFIFDEQKLNDEDVEFAIQLLTTIRSFRNEINEIISTFAKGYNLERTYYGNTIITVAGALTLAIAEMKYFDDIPKVVSIDEALSLVRKFSTEESLKFVNGVLASYKKSIEG